MTTLRFVAAEAWHELRAGCRGPLIPIVFPGLIAYLLLVLLNADYLRDMGATDVPRNSPHLVYLIEIAGQRWLWRDGGWEPVTAAMHVTQRFDDDSRDRRRIGPVPTTVDPGAPFTLIDAWPSFERTPTDNVWRGSRND